MDVADEIYNLLFHKRTNVFLTGAGGTGKTYTVKRLLSRFKNPVKLATTALAAMNFQGETIHSFFWLQRSKDLEELQKIDANRIARWMNKTNISDLKKAEYLYFKRLRGLLDLADVILIDEISMASSNLIDMIFYRLRTMGRPNIPVLVIGDMMQLPPVDKEKDGSVKPPFESQNWDFHMINLEKIWRSEDELYCKVQQRVRFGHLDTKVLQFIKSRKKSETPYDGSTTILAGTNKEVDAINKVALDRLPGETLQIDCEIVIHDKMMAQTEIDKGLKTLTPDVPIRTKPEAKLVLTDNIYNEDGNLVLYNGQQCIFKSYDSDKDIILAEDIKDGHELEIARCAYSIGRNEKVNGSIELVPQVTYLQFPVRLAYAMTIHKSQGQTIDRVHIQCKRIFSAGQFYVAFSRATTTDGLTLSFFQEDKVYADPRYLKFYEQQGVEIN